MPHPTGSYGDPRCKCCHVLLAPGERDYCSKPLCQNRARVMAADALGKAKLSEAREAARLAAQRTRSMRQRAAARIGGRVADEIPADGSTLCADPPGAAGRTGSAGAAADATPTQIAQGIVPHITLAQAAQELDDLARFTRRLNDVLDQCFDPESHIPEPIQTHEDAPEPGFAELERHLPAESPALDSACIACQGQCCMQGRRSHAFLSVRQMQHQRHRDPEVTRAALFAAYMAHLPATHTERSCVYHGPMGCTLPRPMRAGICNRWSCGPRRRLATELAVRGDDRAVVVGLTEDHADSPEPGAAQARCVTYRDGAHEIHADLALDALSETREPV